MTMNFNELIPIYSIQTIIPQKFIAFNKISFYLLQYQPHKSAMKPINQDTLSHHICQESYFIDSLFQSLEIVIYFLSKDITRLVNLASSVSMCSETISLYLLNKSWTMASPKWLVTRGSATALIYVATFSALLDLSNTRF